MHCVRKLKCFDREVGHGDDVICNVPNGRKKLVVPLRGRTSDVREEARRTVKTKYSWFAFGGSADLKVALRNIAVTCDTV